MLQKKLIRRSCSLLSSVAPLYAQKSIAYFNRTGNFALTARKSRSFPAATFGLSPPSGGTASLVVSHPATESRPAFFARRKRLAFRFNRTGGGDIYVLNLERTIYRAITFDDCSWIISMRGSLTTLGFIFRLRAATSPE
jgi:Tol biopolymer transport system component